MSRFPNHNLYVHALELIRERACKGASLEDILGELGCSRSSLEREFKKNLGRQPGQEIMFTRLQCAKQLLATTSLPIKAIAAQVGYGQSSNFGVFFRRYTGFSPSHYRKLHANRMPFENSTEDSNVMYTQSRNANSNKKKEASTAVNYAVSM